MVVTICQTVPSQLVTGGIFLCKNCCFCITPWIATAHHYAKRTMSHIVTNVHSMVLWSSTLVIVDWYSCLSVCLSVGHNGELCYNGWTDWDAVWDIDSGGPKNYGCIRWGPRSPQLNAGKNVSEMTCFMSSTYLTRRQHEFNTVASTQTDPPGDRQHRPGAESDSHDCLAFSVYWWHMTCFA